MKTEHTGQQSLQISQEQMLAFVRAMIGGSRGREDDDHPLPPGPWDPVIRVALERMNVFGPHPDPWRVFRPGPLPWRRIESVFGPLPDPWKVIFSRIVARYPAIWDVIGGGHSFGDEVALNPQPLPPRFRFFGIAGTNGDQLAPSCFRRLPMPRGTKANSRALSLSAGISPDLLMIFAEMMSGLSGRSRGRARIGLPKKSAESTWW